MTKGQLPYQCDFGLWYQVLNLPNDSNNWEESSSSAMFTNAMIVGVRQETLDTRTYVPVINKAWQGLQCKINSRGDVHDQVASYLSYCRV
jgi:rhamnogalacturonyl hydrolase YesR